MNHLKCEVVQSKIIPLLVTNTQDYIRQSLYILILLEDFFMWPGELLQTNKVLPFFPM